MKGANKTAERLTFQPPIDTKVLLVQARPCILMLASRAPPENHRVPQTASASDVRRPTSSDLRGTNQT